MANEEHLAILRQGVEAWNAWRKENRDISSDPDLRGADLGGLDLRGVDLKEVALAGTDLRGTDLGGADLSGSDLSEADLTMGHLRRANLRGTDFRGAGLVSVNLNESDLMRANLNETNLRGADLRGANLKGANLRGANLNEADFNEANLREADLSGARIATTSFGDVDLRATKGLASVVHEGPSTIGIDTIYRSEGKIPEVFLRGCGVPDSLIEYLPSLVGAMEPIQYYSCFLSHSTKNDDFAKRIFSQLRDNQLRVWYAPEELKAGRKLDEQLDDAIRIYDKLILILSEQSLNSKWVKDELRRARKAELANNRRKLFPIRVVEWEAIANWECLDLESGQDLAAEVRDYFIPDFSHWKDHDAFEASFARLLDALRAVDDEPAPRDIASVIAYKKRQLYVLEEQAARMGTLTPSHVVLELEDLRREIAGLERQVSGKARQE